MRIIKHRPMGTQTVAGCDCQNCKDARAFQRDLAMVGEQRARRLDYQRRMYWARRGMLSPEEAKPKRVFGKVILALAGIAGLLILILKGVIL